MQKKSERIYFKNLNVLRFFAALFVVLNHLEHIKTSFNIKSYRSVPFFRESGHIGVVCFFVLSGFLITYLLIEEKERFRKVDIRKFYYRRILRIWPLYYLMILLGFFVLPFVPFVASVVDQLEPVQVVLYSFLMPNIALLFFPPPMFIGQLWSLGVEEQFYAFLPWIVTKSKNLLRVILFFLATFWLVKFTLVGISPLIRATNWNYVLRFLHTTSFDSLLIGSLGAYIIKYGKFKPIINFIFRKKFQYTFCGLLVILIAFGFYFPYLHTQFYSVLFLILILNLAVNPDVIFTLENKTFNYLGKISYGIYMFHQIGIYLAIKIASQLGEPGYLILLVLTLIITLAVSILSYEYFEKKFLRRKVAYENVRTLQ